MNGMKSSRHSLPIPITPSSISNYNDKNYNNNNNNNNSNKRHSTLSLHLCNSLYHEVVVDGPPNPDKNGYFLFF